MAFAHKQISVTFELAQGEYSGGGNQHTVQGLRCMCHIVNQGGPAISTLELAIFGMPLSTMNQLSTVGRQAYKMYKNSIVVQAGDEATGMSVVFEGQIVNAYVDAQSMPQVCFRVTGAPGPYWAVKPATPISVAGSADASQLMSQLADKMGLTFEDAGVKVKLSNPYYGGTLWTQMLQIAKHCGFNVAVERGKLAIVPPDKAREGGAVLISPKTGMVGYPAFIQANVVVYALYNPDVTYLGEIEVQSDITPACGHWKVARLEYELESEVPNGKWFMLIEGVTMDQTVSG